MNIKMRLPKATRKGICISPRMHIARLLFFFIATPILTWYGHQYFTNPYSYHPFITLENLENRPILKVYEESLKGLRDNISIDLLDIYNTSLSDKSDNISISGKYEILISNNHDSTVTNSYSTYSSKIYNYNGNLIIKNDLADIAIIKNFSENSISELKNFDIIILGNISHDSIMDIRSKLSPKLTIILTKDNLISLPKNVINWDMDNRKYIIYSNHRYQLISPERD